MNRKQNESTSDQWFDRFAGFLMPLLDGAAKLNRLNKRSGLGEHLLDIPLWQRQPERWSQQC